MGVHDDVRDSFREEATKALNSEPVCGGSGVNESSAATIRDLVTRHVPDGFRDEDGIWHLGPHQRDALDAVHALVADADRLREFVEHTLNEYGERMPSQWKAHARSVLRAD